MDFSFCVPFGEGDDDPLRTRNFGYVLGYLQAHWPDIRLIVAEAFNTDGTFNRSAARNVAFDQVTTEGVIFYDADVLVPPEQLHAAMTAVEAGSATWAYPFDRWLGLTAEASDEICWDGRLDYEDVSASAQVVEKSWGACHVLPVAAVEAVGGWDDRFLGWGYEDNAFDAAVTELWGPPTCVPGPVYHLAHEAARFGDPLIEEARALWARYQAAVGYPDVMRQVVAQ
jgi:hypothetical protein